MLFKNEEKSSNLIGDSNLVAIYIKNDDMGKYLVELYKEQKKVSERLSLATDENFAELLFLYNPISGRWGTPQKRVCLLTGSKFNKYLKTICKKKGIDKDIEDGI